MVDRVLAFPIEALNPLNSSPFSAISEICKGCNAARLCGNARQLFIGQSVYSRLLLAFGVSF